MNFFYIIKKHLARIFVYSIISLSLVQCSLYEDVDLDESFPVAQDALTQEDTNALSFFILSDWGFNGSNNQKMVENEMENISRLINPKFILTCGDNFQNTELKSAGDLLWETNYENLYTTSSLSVPWYPALGNHDYNGNPEAQIEYSSINDKWNMPGRYYTFVKMVDSTTSVRFIVMDTQGLINDFNKLSNTSEYESLPQYIWLKEVLAGNNEDWLFVTGHHPVFSANPYHGDTQIMKDIIKPLFDEYEVDFYICGHDHNFEHAKENGKYTDYIVTGTGGSLRPAGNNLRTVFSLSELGFTCISLTQNLAKLDFITSEGKIGYSYEKMK